MLNVISAYRGVLDYVQAARKAPRAAWQRLWAELVLDPYWDQWAAGEFNEERTRQELSRPEEDLDGLERVARGLAISRVEDVVRAAYEKISRMLPCHDDPVAICILPCDPVNAGVVGTCVGGNTLLTVSTEKPDWQDWIGYVLAHERHHSAWGYHYYFITHGNRRDLLISLISEGSADAFASRLYPSLKPDWLNALTPEQESAQWAAMLPLLDVPDPEYALHRRFFFGEGQTPASTGYTIGYHIVQAYISRHSDQSVSDWTQCPPEVILAESGYSSLS